MGKIINKHKILWAKKEFVWATISSLALFGLSLAAAYYSNYYASLSAGAPVRDIILDNLPPMNMNFIFTDGALIFLLTIIATLIFYRPASIPFVIKASALFIIIRSVFITLTHFGPPNGMSYIDPNSLLYKFSSGDDLFFSGHTGFPFLMALIFWDNKYLRYLLLSATLVAAVAVLLGHLHYSIDVLAAPFITFGIYTIAKWVFVKDYKFAGDQN
ncbi:MAG: sphingomyelin synthase family protein [Patescibacteria group bacterium]|nr:sphingomyelin synthase family protein [Patescibacteria group bacterium]